jgi:hypothetical protein
MYAEGYLLGLFHFKQAFLQSPTFQTNVSSKLIHVSEHVPTRFGLVDTKLSSQGAHPNLSNVAEAQPTFLHGTALCCRAET